MRWVVYVEEVRDNLKKQGIDPDKWAMSEKSREFVLGMGLDLGWSASRWATAMGPFEVYCRGLWDVPSRHDLMRFRQLRRSLWFRGMIPGIDIHNENDHKALMHVWSVLGAEGARGFSENSHTYATAGILWDYIQRNPKLWRICFRRNPFLAGRVLRRALNGVLGVGFKPLPWKLASYLGESDIRSDAKYRALDRLYRNDPAKAAKADPDSYQLGIKIAAILWAAVGHLIGLLRRGESIVLHGRDGEILFHMLQRIEGWNGWKTRVSYVVSSRPLTSEWRDNGPKDRPKKLWDYLKVSQKVGPAWHVDTGYRGSIPKWMKASGWNVKGILLISASNPDYQIPEVLDAFDESLIPESYSYSKEGRLWDFVIKHVEHSPQRLEKLPDSQNWDGFKYSEEVVGYWAKLQGIMDARPYGPELPPVQGPFPL